MALMGEKDEDIYTFEFQDGAKVEVRKGLLKKYPLCELNEITKHNENCTSDGCTFSVNRSVNKVPLMIRYMEGFVSSLELIDPNTLLELYKDLLYYNKAYQKELINYVLSVIKTSLFNCIKTSNDELRVVRTYMDDEGLHHLQWVQKISYSHQINFNETYGLFHYGCPKRRYCDIIEKYRGLLNLLTISVFHIDLYLADVENDYTHIINKKMYTLIQSLLYIDIDLIYEQQRKIGIDTIKIFMYVPRNISTIKYESPSTVKVDSIELSHVENTEVFSFILKNPYLYEIEEIVPGDISDSVRQAIFKMYNELDDSFFTSFNVSNCVPGGKGFNDFLKILDGLNLKRFTTLNMSNNDWTPYHLNTLFQHLLSKNLKGCQELNLSGNVFHSDGFKSFASLLTANRNFRFHTLYLRDVSFSSQYSMTPLISLCKQPDGLQLDLLDISNNIGIDSALKDLSESSEVDKTPCVKKIICNNCFNGSSFTLYSQYISSTSAFHSSSFHYIKDNKDTDLLVSFPRLLDAGTFYELEVLSLSGYGLYDSDVLSLLTTLNKQYMPKLNTLDLSYNNITGIGLKELFIHIQQKELLSLTELYLHGNANISSGSYIYIFNGLTAPIAPYLRTLTLYENHIGDDGFIAYLAGTQKHNLPMLTTLNFSRCDITDSSFVLLISVLQNGLLEYLDTLILSNNMFSFPACQSLLSAINKQQIPHLNYLDIRNIHLSPSEKREFSRQIESCSLFQRGLLHYSV
ncbi:hypothetical protein WA158_000319 [Blastocystis sp. Blastoise]